MTIEISHIAKLPASGVFRSSRWDGQAANSHNANMAEKSKFFLQQWRKHRGYTLERLAEMVGTSAGVISDLEKGNRRFNQDHLDMFAEALRCSPGDLITRDPTDPEGLWDIYEQLKPVERVQAVKIIKAIRGSGTGTDG